MEFYDETISKKYITGILYLDSKIKYGNQKDKQIYLFKPTNRQYPDFYVPYKTDIRRKLYVNIKFKEISDDGKYFGTVIDIIGNLGDKDAEFEHLRNYYEIKNNTWKIDNKKIKSDLEKLKTLDNQEEDYKVFSIDPEGSKDIDDAFHYNRYPLEGGYEIGIHIANPVVFFKDSYQNVLDRVSTVYLPTSNKKYNMLPSIYADDMVSLLENKKRFALSLIIKLNDKFEIISENIRESIVLNFKNYTYENFDLTEFMDLSKSFFPESFISDTHKLVEYWMIFANKRIASHLMNLNPLNLILRKHDNKMTNESHICDCDPKLSDFLKLRNENSAIYEIFDSEKIQTHSKLDNENYTHFTSPIRRAVDFFIHMLITDKEFNIKRDELIMIIDNINRFTKNVRKFDRQVRRLNFLFDIKSKNKNVETYGYITEIKENKISVYIPEYNLEEKIIIIPKKLGNIADIIINTESINYIIDNVEYSYTLYQKINLRLYIFLTFENIFDKLKIEIVKT